MRGPPWVNWSMTPTLRPAVGVAPRITLSARLGARDHLMGTVEQAGAPRGQSVRLTDASRLHFRVGRARPTLGDPGLVAEAAGVLPGRIEALTPLGLVAGLTVGAPLFENLGALLRAAVAAGPPAPDTAGHLVVACDAMVVRELPTQIEALMTLAALGWSVDLWATHPAADLGALAQLALVGRGELVFGPPSGARHGHRLRALAGPAASPVRLEVMPAPGVRVEAIFRAAPTVLYYGQPADAGPGGPVAVHTGTAVLGAEQHWLFDLALSPGWPELYLTDATGAPVRLPPGVPPPDGHWLARARAVTVPVDGAPPELLGDWHTFRMNRHPDPHGRWVVEATVARARERAEISLEFEHIAAAFARGDGRRVAQGISSLVRLALSLGDDTTAERAYALRLGFLRTGTVDRGELNRLRVALWAGV